MSKFTRCLSVLSLALILAPGISSLFGQGTDLGIIRGTVVDSQGGAVVGARVSIVDLVTGIVIETLSNSAGDYEVVSLKSGTYKVSAVTDGFNTTEVLDVIVRTGATSRVNVKLTPKVKAEVVTVTSEAPLIQTEAPVVSGTLNTQQIQDLPRDSRDIYQFLYLNPNILYNPDDGFKFMGGSSYGANFSMDGQRATGAGFGQAVGGQPSLETIGEVTVLSNSFSAEYGGIANIRVTTKRGTAGYHGSLFYDNKNSALAAWRATDKIDQANFSPSFFQPAYPHPSFNFTETGGSFGGPIPKMGKRTFFMFAFEKRWDAEPMRWSSSNKVPHETLLTGDFSKISDSAKPAVPAGTSLTADEIQNNTVGGLGAKFIKIPSRLLNPYTSKLVNLYFPHTSLDAPINSTRGYVSGYTMLTRGLLTRPLYTGRIDHDFSDRDKVYGVINFSTQDGGFSALNNPFSSLGTQHQERTNQTLSLSWIHNFKPTLINEARGGLNWQNSYRRANEHVGEFLSSIGFSQADIQAYSAAVSPLAPDLWGTFPIYVGNFGPFGNMGRSADRTLNQRMWSVGDTVSWIKGRHSVRGGFDLVHNFVEDAFTIGRGNPRGRIDYATNLGGWAQFLMGLPANSMRRNIAPRGPMHATNWEHGYFVQDDWKITPRLTLNLGLRYELITPFIEQDDLLVNFDFNYKNPTSGELGRFVFPSEATLKAADPRQVAYGYVFAKDLDLSRGLVRTDGNNFAPRVGLAFRLTEKTVLRGGYGIFYPTSAAQGMRDSMATNSFNQSITFTNKPANPLQAWPRPFSGGVQNTVSQYPSINAIPFDLQQPRIQQFNVTFEREVGWKTAVRVSYLGSRVWGLGAGIDQNAIRPSDNPLATTTGDGVTPCDPVNNGDCELSSADQARIPYPHLGDWLMINGGNFGSLQSNALQIEVNRSLAKGLMFNFSYTYLDQKNSVTDADSSLGNPVYNPFNPTGDYGWDSFVTRHRFIAYGTYEVPVGQGRRYAGSMNKFLNAVAGGWQTSWHLFAKSGTGFTPYWNCNDCGPTTPGNIFSSAISPAGWNGTHRPLVIGDPNKRSGDLIWDIAAFAPPSIGADLFSNAKNATRNMLIGPSVWAANFAVTKDFRINERAKLSFRAVFDNIFNHPTFAPTGPNDTSINYLGDFNLEVNQTNAKLLPITDVTLNPDFGRLYGTYSHEGIDDRRSVRISLRLVF